MRNRAQKRRDAGAAQTSGGKLRIERGLAQAFLTFTQAAGSLEKSYTLLQSEVERLHGELGKANAELDATLRENARVRVFLSQVLENLPCGVVVSGAGGKVQILNPQARRLLQFPSEWNQGKNCLSPELLEKLLTVDAGAAENREQEWPEAGESGNRSLGISCARLGAPGDSESERIWIIRDITEQKRTAAERERTQQALALAEMTALLAHEIRNPLGSMELFTGLLEEAVANNPETRQWLNHLRAGLRSLSATITNVVDVYINYLRRKIDAGSDRPLIRTIRGVGYQIGGNHYSR